MHRNRFSQMFELPAQAPPQAAVPVGFALCPVFVLQLQPQAQAQPTPIQELYRRAYEQAQEKVRISRLEKRFFSVWN
ncbi:MAG: hypothetical protein HYX69_20365 [Planctomycetia bacterium]|nr:hypothetical protein [Planctomycetia bacterium]